jgi:hypothetical protein
MSKSLGLMIFAGTSEILQKLHKSHASNRLAPAKFCWRAPENTVTLTVSKSI